MKKLGQNNAQALAFLVVLGLGAYGLKEAGALKYQITLLFSLYAFFAALLDKDKYVIYLLVFVLPFKATPFMHAKFTFLDGEFPILFGLNSFIIFGVFLGRLLKNTLFGNSYQDNFREICLIKKWLFFFLLLAIALPLLSDGYNPFVHAKMAYSYVNFICYIIILILFISIIMPENIKAVETLMVIFMLSVVLQLFSYVAMKSNLSVIPTFLIDGSTDRGSYSRFYGLIGDYELVIDYLMMIIAFSTWFIYNNKYKIFSSIILFIALFMGLISGTRSFLVVLAVFVTVNTGLILFKARVRFKVATVIFVLMAIVLGWNLNVSKMAVFQTMYYRTLESISSFKNRGLAEATNRNMAEAIPIVIEKAGFFGHGSFVSTEFCDHQMVPHSLYLDIYSKFGLFGILSLSYLFFTMMKISYRIANNQDYSEKKEFIFFSLLIALAAQQYKISALRFVNSILMYAFLFIVMYALYRSIQEGVGYET